MDPGLKKGYWAPEEDAVSGRPWRPRRLSSGMGAKAPTIPSEMD